MPSIKRRQKSAFISIIVPTPFDYIAFRFDALDDLFRDHLIHERFVNVYQASDNDYICVIWMPLCTWPRASKHRHCGKHRERA